MIAKLTIIITHYLPKIDIVLCGSHLNGRMQSLRYCAHIHPQQGLQLVLQQLLLVLAVSELVRRELHVDLQPLPQFALCHLVLHQPHVRLVLSELVRRGLMSGTSALEKGSDSLNGHVSRVAIGAVLYDDRHLYGRLRVLSRQFFKRSSECCCSIAVRL